MKSRAARLALLVVVRDGARRDRVSVQEERDGQAGRDGGRRDLQRASARLAARGILDLARRAAGLRRHRAGRRTSGPRASRRRSRPCGTALAALRARRAVDRRARQHRRGHRFAAGLLADGRPRPRLRPHRPEPARLRHDLLERRRAHRRGRSPRSTRPPPPSSARAPLQIDTLARRQTFALVAAAAAAGLVMLLLLPRVENDFPSPAFLEPSAPVPLRGQASGREAGPCGRPLTKRWSAAAPRRMKPRPPPLRSRPPPHQPRRRHPSGASRRQRSEPGAAAAAVPPFDFKSIAALCTELSRVDDTMALPPLLERAAALLDAAGIILWIADPDGRELNPVLAQGYPQHLVNRLGTIPRNAENATAAAYPHRHARRRSTAKAVRMARSPRRSSRAAAASA